MEKHKSWEALPCSDLLISDYVESNRAGIVERVENGTVYTVEGNSGDECRQNSYSIGSSFIYGCGTPAY